MRLVLKHYRKPQAFKNMKTQISETIDRSSSGEDGLTLIECLVAIIVIGLTIATIGPMVVFTVATRVQNQRTEQALQLAQAEIDKVRLVVEQGGDYADQLNDLALISTGDDTLAANVDSPIRFVASTADVAATTDARKIDSDGDGNNDFAIQLFRTRSIEVDAQGSAPDTPVTFEMGVRVYDIRSETNMGSLQTEAAGLIFTSGEGQRGTRPLAVLYTHVTQGDRIGSLCQYWEATSTSGTAPASLACS